MKRSRGAKNGSIVKKQPITQELSFRGPKASQTIFALEQRIAFDGAMDSTLDHAIDLDVLPHQGSDPWLARQPTSGRGRTEARRQHALMANRQRKQTLASWLQQISASCLQFPHLTKHNIQSACAQRSMSMLTLL